VGPDDRNVLYFVTTDRFNTKTSPGRSRLWRLTFVDAAKPELGGTVDMMLDGTEGQQMLDNITVNLRPGPDAGGPGPAGACGEHVAVLAAGRQAHGDRALRSRPLRPGTPNFLTQDEESSGIIDAALVLGPGWYLFDVECKEWTDGQIGNNDSSYDVRDVDLAPATC
jgi:hypothetical protein